MLDKAQTLGKPGVRVSLLAGSATVLCGFLYLLYKNRRTASEVEFDLPKDTVIQILREFRKEFYTLCKSIQAHSVRYQEMLRSRQPFSQAQMKEILEEYYASPLSGIPEQIQDIENKVYLKFDVANRREFERFYQSLAKEDHSIKAYREEIKTMYERAVMGIMTVPQFEIPERITPDLLIAAYRKYFKVTLRKMSDFTFDFISLNGRSAVNTPLFQQGFHRLDLDGERNTVAKEFGIDFKDEFYPHQLMSFCKERFERQDAKFAQKFAELESFRFSFIQKLMSAEYTKESLTEEIPKIDFIAVPLPEVTTAPQTEPIALSEPITEVAPLPPSDNKEQPIFDSQEQLKDTKDSQVALTKEDVLSELAIVTSEDALNQHRETHS